MHAKMTVVVCINYKNHRLIYRWTVIVGVSCFIIHYKLIVVGPAIYTVNNTRNETIHQIVAIVSYGFGCATPHIPGYYAPVYPQLEWIREVLKQTNECKNTDKKAKDGLATCSTITIKNQIFFTNLVVLYLIHLVSSKIVF